MNLFAKYASLSAAGFSVQSISKDKVPPLFGIPLASSSFSREFKKSKFSLTSDALAGVEGEKI